MLLLALVAAAACAKKESKGSDAPPAAVAAPVRVVSVTRASLTEIVAGPGRTAALVQQKVRAPFAGTLTELQVMDGDSVQRGQVLGTIVSRESEAALSGARAMMREARTAAEKQDAERALALAEKNRVYAPLPSSTDGRVLAHSASRGDRVSEDQEILTIEDTSSIVFLADIAQGELPRIRPGQNASLEIGGGSHPVPGVVHGVLPNANPADFTAPVRIDLRPGSNRFALGLFGTVRIIVGRRENALVVPDAAILRDDVSGVSRICLAVHGTAHWIDIVPGVRDSGRTEIVSPSLADGQAVIVSGLVGLPEGKSISAQLK